MSNHTHAVALSRPSPTSKLRSAEFSVQVVQYIMDHLRDDLSASTIAARFSAEEAGLLCAFESHTGIGLDQFVLRRRIERALDLLKNSNAGDSEIALRIGFGTARAFQAVFSKYLRVSPKDYQRNLPRKSQAANLEIRERRCKRAHLHEDSRGRGLRALAV